MLRSVPSTALKRRALSVTKLACLEGAPDLRATPPDPIIGWAPLSVLRFEGSDLLSLSAGCSGRHHLTSSRCVSHRSIELYGTGLSWSRVTTEGWRWLLGVP